MRKSERIESPDLARIYYVMSMVFCCGLVISNIVAAKTLDLGVFSLPASIIIYPVIYIVNDVVTDVFGFKLMRQTIIWGFIAAAVSTVVIQLSIAIPGSDAELSAAFETALSNSWRILLASYIGFISGSMLNSFIMDDMKRGFERQLFLRCLVSTAAGEFADSTIFITIAFAGIYPLETILIMIVSQIIFKVLYEMVLYPATRKIIIWVRGRKRTMTTISQSSEA